VWTIDFDAHEYRFGTPLAHHLPNERTVSIARPPSPHGRGAGRWNVPNVPANHGE
jgi:hypothetical protein